MPSSTKQRLHPFDLRAHFVAVAMAAIQLSACKFQSVRAESIHVRQFRSTSREGKFWKRNFRFDLTAIVQAPCSTIRVCFRPRRVERTSEECVMPVREGGEETYLLPREIRSPTVFAESRESIERKRERRCNIQFPAMIDASLKMVTSFSLVV